MANKTYNLYEVMENLTGISKTEQKKLMKEVQENRRKLDSCPLHDFSIDVTPNKSYDKRFQCPYCGGITSESNKRWYELGRKHEYEHKKD